VNASFASAERSRMAYCSFSSSLPVPLAS
jgi:hypothetical protein